MFDDYSAAEAKQSRSNVVVERQKVTSLPAEFFTMTGYCSALSGQPATDTQGRPRKQRMSLAPAAAIIEKISISNNTGHILRLDGAVMAMFDPADNENQSLDKDQIASLLALENPCAISSDLTTGLKLVKLIDRNTRILPSRTTEGYLMFTPASQSMPGMWRLSLYEFPVAYDAAGRVTKTVQFDFNTQAKRCIETYRRDSPISPPVLVGTNCDAQ